MSPPSFGNLAARLFVTSLGLLFLFPSAYKLYSYSVFRYQAVSVDGVVTDAGRGRDLGGRPFVAYQDLQGHSYEKKSAAKTHWFVAPRIGEKLAVFYDPDDPGRAIVDSPFHYILLPIFFIAVGACFLIGAVRESQREIRRSASKGA
jgi:hypothetical protein